MHAHTDRHHVERGRLRRLLTLLLLLPGLAFLGVQGIPAASAVSELCPGTHLDPPDDDTPSFTYTAPDGFLVSAWCVKAGTTTDLHDAGDGHGHLLPAKSVTIQHSSGKDVSHFSVTLVPAPDEKPLTVGVTASGSLARDHAWSIEKHADATSRTVDAGGNATFTYTVTVRAGAASESGWAMSGSVTVGNPNDEAIVADVTASTDLGGGASCQVTGGNDVAVPAGDDVTLPITCTFTSAPAASGAITATATWDAEDAGESPVSDSSPVSLTATETNKTVDVVDDKTVPGQRVVLQSGLAWAEGLVKTYTYSLAVPGGAPGQCRTHTNTATVDKPVGTDPSDTAVVEACAPPPVPPVPPVVIPPVQVPAPEVLAEETFGKATGRVRASCQGTVTARMRNATGGRVTYVLKVGKKTHRVKVASGKRKTVQTKGKARARVVLKVGPQTLDRVRIPALCAPPEVLPDTGVRVAVQAARWR